MALCSLCSTLPFTDFPPQRSFWGLCTIADDYEFIVSPHVCNDRLLGPIGFPYHENIGALAESAKTCPLCAVVQAGVQTWLVSWNKAAGTKKSIESSPYLYTLPVEERLWLTKLESGNQGFCVWTMNPLNRRSTYQSLYLLALVGFNVEERMLIPPINLTSSTKASCEVVDDMLFPDSPLKDEFRVRPMDPDSGSSRGLDWAASWVQECVDNHPSCSDGDNVLLPSRILKVEAEGDTITLVDGSSVSGSIGKYTCLSYCWGDSPPYTTTRATIQARRAGMRINEMPQTFIDAVTVTRRLGLKYLWIDSLCICQDDPEDWARESGLMADIYSNAYIVIAANRSADSTGGCFHKRAPRAKALVRIPTVGTGSGGYINATMLYPSDHSGHEDDSFCTEPLSERGWALQERTMAQRTLHYNERQMYFECLQGLEAEDGHIQYVSKSSWYQLLSTPECSIALWYFLIEDFGRRKVSRATDKLPALSGWAKKVHEAIGADYVAGLWSNALVQGMAWKCEGERKPASLDEYTGPTWSWASYGGIASYLAAYDWVIAEVLCWHVELKEEANPFGEVRDAWIKVRGPVLELKPRNSGRYSAEDGYFEEVKVSIPKSTVNLGSHELSLDNQSYEESEGWRNWDLQAMLLCGQHGKESGGLVQGIVFREATRAGQRGKMERVGHMEFIGYETEKLLRFTDQWYWETITIV